MKELLNEKEINSLRGLSFVFGVLSYLQGDPFCSRCSFFVESVDVAKDIFLYLEKSVNKNKDIPEDMRRLLLNIYGVLADLNIPDNPERQKTEGNCVLPKGVCFAKLVLTVYEKIKG